MTLADDIDAVYLDDMTLRLPGTGLKRWLVWVWEHLPFARRRGGPGLAGVREPRRPYPPTQPPQALAAQPEDEGFRASPAATLTRADRRRWWHRVPRARHA